MGMGLGLGIGRAYRRAPIVLSSPHAGWTIPFPIVRRGSVISHGFNAESVKPGYGDTYFVNHARPDNSGSGTSAATAFRDIPAGLVKAGIGSLILAPGRYMAGAGWFNSVYTGSLRVEVDGPGEAWLIQCPSRTYPVWTLGSGARYTTPIAALSSLTVLDLGILDIDGNPMRLTKVASSAAVAATPGTWFHDGTLTHAHAADSRSLIGDQNIVTITNTNNVRWEPAAANAKLALKGIGMIGGSRPYYVSGPTLGILPVGVLEQCRFIGATVANGVNWGAPGELYLHACKAAYNELDGINVHGQAAGTIATPSPDVYELDSIVGRNGYTGSTNNASTVHERTRILRVNPLYRTSAQRTLADIDETKSWTAGGEIGPSLASDVTGNALQCASIHPHFMDSVRIAKGLGATDIEVANGLLRIHNMNLAGLGINVPANVTAFTP